MNKPVIRMFRFADRVRHPVLLLLALLGVFLAALEIRQIWPVEPLPCLLYCMLACSFVLMVVRPVEGSWGVIASGFLLCLVPVHHGPFIVSGMLIALGVLSFCSTWMIWMLGLLICSCAYAARSVLLGSFSMFVSISVAVMFLTSVLTGRLVALMRQGQARERQRLTMQVELQRLDHMRQTNRLAICIHDSLTNSLSDLSLLARNHLDGHAIGNDDWRIVLDVTQEAFAKVHEILDVLSETEKPEAPEVSFMSEVDGLARQSCDRLNAMGYEGGVSIDGLCVNPLPEQREEALSLIVELCNNIERHGEPRRGSFELLITFSVEALEIRQINDIASRDSLTDDERSGRGLTLHERRIRDLGGVLTSRSDDGVWVLYARIPLKPASEEP